MVSRRSVLAAAGAGAAGALAGCLDALPLVGGDSGPPATVAGTTNSFLANPSLGSVVDAVRSPSSTECTVESFDGSIAEHADALGVEGDLSNYGLWALAVGEDEARAIDTIDHTAVATYRTTWQHDAAEGQAPRYGRAAGGVGYYTGSYDREAYAAARELADSPTDSVGGYDLYVGDDRSSSALASDRVLQAASNGVSVPGEHPEEPGVVALSEDLLRRGAKRTTDAASPPGWVGDLVSELAPFHAARCEYSTRPDTPDQAFVTGLHVDGDATTVMLGGAAASASTFDAEEWTGRAIEDRLAAQVGRMAEGGIRDMDDAQDLLVSAPAVEVGDRRGVARVRMASSAVVSPYPP